MRCLQYLECFKEAGIDYEVSPLFEDEMLLRKYQHGQYSLNQLVRSYLHRIYLLMITRHRFNLIWIEKEALPWFPVWFEKLLLRDIPYALDFDDAIFHNYDLNANALLRYFYGYRIDRLVRDANLVVAGNYYLANWAIAAGANKVEMMPTVVDMARYNLKNRGLISNKPIIVWIGSPSTLQYLDELAEPLRLLAMKQAFIFRTIGSGVIDMPGVNIECLDWSIDNEADLIAMCDIGVMPLNDGAWEQGKCAYKLIQYMACGLPTVASPVGANLDVVVDGFTGFFATKVSDWLEKLELLLSDQILRSRLGLAGRARVEENYCLQQTAPRLMSLLNQTIDP